MTYSKHTPGPWKISEKRANGTKAYVDGSAGYVVAQAYCSPSSNIKYNDLWEEAEANARLIAAAPDLLHFAEKVRDYARETDDESLFAAADDLISKATTA